MHLKPNFFVDLAHQGWSTEHGIVKCFKSFAGTKLIGAKAQSIFSNHNEVYVWPAIQNDAWKWVHTGLIISCPSISYADCYLWKCIRDDKEIRRQYGLDDSQVMPFDSLDLISTRSGLLRDLDVNTLKKELSRTYWHDIDILINGDYVVLVNIEGFDAA